MKKKFERPKVEIISFKQGDAILMSDFGEMILSDKDWENPFGGQES